MAVGTAGGIRRVQGFLEGCRELECVPGYRGEADAALGSTHISLGGADSSPSNWREAV